MLHQKYRQSRRKLLLMAPFWPDAHWLPVVWSLLYRGPGGSDSVSPSSSTGRPVSPFCPSTASGWRLASFKAILTGTGVSEEVAEFLFSSRRGSTAVQYRSVWRSWLSWCQDHGLDPASVSLNTMLEYLYYLFSVKDLAWSTIGVHRSAISSLLQPLHSHSVGEHPLVSRFMRALFLRTPPSSTPRWTWDMATVLAFVRA